MGEPAGEDRQGGRPTFSVLVATYNQAEYVVETLQSVSQQTCSDYELVVVDDGSADDTRARISAWLETFARTHCNRAGLETIENSGQSAAMEHGFALCSGKYICLLDSDDRWLPHKLETLRSAASASPEAGMLMHPLHVIDSNGHRTGDVRPKRARLPDGDLREEVRRTSRLVAPATSGLVIRTDVFRELVPMATRTFRTAPDLYLALGAALLAPVRAVEEPLAEYRMHPGGQHIQTMLSTEGVRHWVNLQAHVLAHFGIERSVAQNSYFLRHIFALAKLDQKPSRQFSAFLRLVRATWLDDSFAARERVLFTGYWTVCLVAPRPLFRRLWRAFQVKQTGFDKIGLGKVGPPGSSKLGHGGSG